jgi:anaerobic ribonucleoside-triphosphate reductase activating protein
MRIAQIVERTDAEGPGERFALWFQGCPLRCPGCCNPEFLPFSGGEQLSFEEIAARIPADVEGISLLGGEPFAHAADAARIAAFAQSRRQGVMVYTGYLLEELQLNRDPAIAELLARIDLLVDGPYDRTQPEPLRRWIGSANQRLHFLTPRYDPQDPCWQRRNTLEIRVRGGEVSVNGFPAAGAVGLWKRVPRPTAR